MSIRHLEDGRFEIIKPMFFKWPAKEVILSMLLAEISFSIIFLLKSTNIFALLLLSLMFLSALFAIGYNREVFPVIYIHFVLCFVYILISLTVVSAVYFDPSICDKDCQTITQRIENVGLPVKEVWAYSFSGFIIIAHVLMTPVSFRMMKYTAARRALDKMMADEEFTKKLQRPVILNSTYPMHV
ncbi:unnamed protein product [Caenorhabditis brenneri]